MPVYNNISGSWNLVVINKDCVFAETADTSYNLSISPSQVITGAGETLVRKMDNIDASVSISGPILFRTSNSNGTSSSDDFTVNTINYPDIHDPSGEDFGCQDVYHYILDTLCPILESTDIEDKFWGIKTINLQFGSNGCKASASWWMDPEISVDNSNSGGAGTTINHIPWVVAEVGATIPMRTANWYDFVFIAEDLTVETASPTYSIVQDFDATIEFSYDTWNPLGGAEQIVNAISDSDQNNSVSISGNYIGMWNHIPIRILKSIDIKFNVNSVMSRKATKPPWGTGLYSEEPILLDYQNVDALTFTELAYDIYPWSGPGTYSDSDPTNNIGLVESLINAIVSNYQYVGLYIKSASGNIKPGIMTSKIEGELIIPISGI